MHKVRRSAGALRRLVCACAIAAAIVLAGQSAVMFTPLVNGLAENLLVEPDIRKADAIVVLAGGAYNNGALDRTTLMRVIRGAELYRGGLAGRMILSGGNMLGQMLDITISLKMSELASGLGVPRDAQLIDTASLRTYENALESRRLMEENGLRDAILVTSATHMRRSALTFRRLGMTVYPAPAPAYETLVTDPLERLGMFKIVMREYVGMLFYRWKGWI